jgi:hypothetical protein
MFAELTDIINQLAHHPGHVYADLIPVALIGTVVVIVVHFLLVLITRPSLPRSGARWNLWEKLLYLGLLVCVVDLAATAFYSVLQFGSMSGWFLFVHMFGAGALVALLPLITITWAESNRFGRGQQPTREQPRAKDRSHELDEAPQFLWLSKLAFWIILASGLVTVMTMLLSMLPLFDTEGLHGLLDIHRYTGLLLVVATMFHFYGVLLRRLGLR